MNTKNYFLAALLVLPLSSAYAAGDQSFETSLAAEKKKFKREADIENEHKGRKLDITLIPNPNFIPLRYLNQQFQFKGESINLIDVAVSRFSGKNFIAMLHAAAEANGYDPLVIEFLLGARGEPEGLTGESKAQLCAVVQKIEDKVNIELGIPRYGDVETIHLVGLKPILDAAFPQIGFTPSATLAPVYPCD